MKRITLLIVTNVAIMLVLSLVVSALGFDRYLTQRGLDLQLYRAARVVDRFPHQLHGSLVEQARIRLDQPRQQMNRPPAQPVVTHRRAMFRRRRLLGQCDRRGQRSLPQRLVGNSVLRMAQDSQHGPQRQEIPRRIVPTLLEHLGLARADVEAMLAGNPRRLLTRLGPG